MGSKFFVLCKSETCSALKLCCSHQYFSLLNSEEWRWKMYLAPRMMWASCTKQSIGDCLFALWTKCLLSVMCGWLSNRGQDHSMQDSLRKSHHSRPETGSWCQGLLSRNGNFNLPVNLYFSHSAWWWTCLSTSSVWSASWCWSSLPSLLSINRWNTII